MTQTPIIAWLIRGLQYWTDVTQSAQVGGHTDALRGLRGWGQLMSQYVKEHGPLTGDQVKELRQSITDAGDRVGSFTELSADDRQWALEMLALVDTYAEKCGRMQS